MKDLKKTASQLAEKNSWVRKASKGLMEKWADISECGENITSNTTLTAHDSNGGDEADFNLMCGESELKSWYERKDDLFDIDKGYHFTEILSMRKLRRFLEIFPIMVEEIKTKMKENIEKANEIQKMLEKLK